jgi:MFS family permease
VTDDKHKFAACFLSLITGRFMKNRQAAIIFILVTVTLDILAMGLIIPVLPKLILDFLGGVMTDTARWSGRFAVVFALMQFFFSPLLGVLSDRFGRRPVILLSNLGLGLDYIVMAMAPTLYWLFLGRLISGITTSSIPTAMAYISDVTPKEKRAGAFGMIGVAFGIGFILGPGLGGLLGKSDPRLAFWVAAGLSLLNWPPAGKTTGVRFATGQSGRLAQTFALASRTLAACYDSISRFHRAQYFRRLGPLRHVSICLEHR